MARAQRCDARRNRECLLQAASDVFVVRGVDAPLEEIARSAGVGIGTLYRHFPTRDALVEAVYRHNVEQLCSGAEELARTKEPDEALAEWMQRFVSYVASKKGLATYLKSVVTADSDVFTSSHERVHETICRLVDQAAAAGRIRTGVDGMDLLRALSGVCLMSEQATGPEQGAKLAALLMDGLRYGAAAPAPVS